MTAPDDGKDRERRDEAIAGEYVLGLLSQSDRRKVEARIETDTRFAALVARWEANFSPLNDDYEQVVPPAGAFTAVEKRLFGAAPASSQSGSLDAGLWNSARFWRWAALASLVIAIGAVLSTSMPRGTQQSGLVAELSGDGAAVNLLARYDGESGRLRFTPVAARQPEQKSLELWLVEGNAPPVSLGVLPQTGDGEVFVPPEMRPRLVAGAVLAVSLEPFGGSPTGTATGPVIASGSVRRALDQ